MVNCSRFYFRRRRAPGENATRALFFGALFLCSLISAEGLQPELVYAYQEDKTFELPPGVSSKTLTPILHLAKTLASEAGIPMRVVRTPVTRMFRNLNSGTANFCVMVKSPKVEDCCISSQLPAHKIPLGVFRRPGVDKINSIEGLNNKKLIVLHGYRYSDLGAYLDDPKNNIEKVMAPSHRSAFSLLAAKRADYLLDYDGPAVRREGQGLDVQTEFDTLKELDLHIVLNKNYPNAKAVMRKFETIVAGMKTWGNGVKGESNEPLKDNSNQAATDVIEPRQADDIVNQIKSPPVLEE